VSLGLRTRARGVVFGLDDERLGVRERRAHRLRLAGRGGACLLGAADERRRACEESFLLRARGLALLARRRLADAERGQLVVAAGELRFQLGRPRGGVRRARERRGEPRHLRARGVALRRAGRRCGVRRGRLGAHAGELLLPDLHRVPRGVELAEQRSARFLAAAIELERALEALVELGLAARLGVEHLALRLGERRPERVELGLRGEPFPGGPSLGVGGATKRLVALGREAFDACLEQSHALRGGAEVLVLARLHRHADAFPLERLVARGEVRAEGARGLDRGRDVAPGGELRGAGVVALGLHTPCRVLRLETAAFDLGDAGAEGLRLEHDRGPLLLRGLRERTGATDRLVAVEVRALPRALVPELLLEAETVLARPCALGLGEPRREMLELGITRPIDGVAIVDAARRVAAVEVGAPSRLRAVADQLVERAETPERPRRRHRGVELHDRLAGRLRGRGPDGVDRAHHVGDRLAERLHAPGVPVRRRGRHEDETAAGHAVVDERNAGDRARRDTGAEERRETRVVAGIEEMDPSRAHGIERRRPRDADVRGQLPEDATTLVGKPDLDGEPEDALRPVVQADGARRCRAGVDDRLQRALERRLARGRPPPGNLAQPPDCHGHRVGSPGQSALDRRSARVGRSCRGARMLARLRYRSNTEID
jgi:hypothetical protein